MGGRLTVVELRVRDVDSSVRFYRDLVGLKIDDPEDHKGTAARHAHATWGSPADGGDNFLMLNIYPANPGEETQMALGFSVEDLDDTHDRLERAGVEVLRPPEAMPWGRSAAYRDPDGNRITLNE